MLGYTWYFGTRGTWEGTDKNIKKIETRKLGDLSYICIYKKSLCRKEKRKLKEMLRKDMNRI